MTTDNPADRGAARFRPSRADLAARLPLVARGSVLTHATMPTDVGEPDRATTYPTRLALLAAASADAFVASAARAGVPGRHVLDLACGPAVLSRLLVEAGAEHVVALDHDPLMLAASRALNDLTPPAVTTRLSLDLAAAEVLPLDDNSIDLVWIGDFWAAATLPEVRRVLRPCGRLVLRFTRSTVTWLPAEPTEDAPAGSPAFAARIETAAAAGAGAGAWLKRQSGWRDPLPDGALPGWELLDSWPEDLSWTFPVPELVQEYLLQDFACFHGRFTAAHAEPADWARLCELADPDSDRYALRRQDARVSVGHDYQVLRVAPSSC